MKEFVTGGSGLVGSTIIEFRAMLRAAPARRPVQLPTVRHDGGIGRITP